MQTLTLSNTADKATLYQEILPQIRAIVADESDMIANMGNICAVLKSAFDWLWIGFYRVDTTANQLVLGPFQGPLACTRIPYGRGVCGEVWETQQTMIIDDVLNHTNHIACSSLSRSEIVLPVFNHHQEIIAVLDIDSANLASFDQTDQTYLNEIIQLLH